MDEREFSFLQGDQGYILFQVILGNQFFTPSHIDEIEVCVDRFARKLWSEHEIYYDSMHHVYSFILTLADTLFMKPGRYNSLIRVKLKNFDATGNNFIYTFDGPNVRIFKGYSKEIL